MLLTPRTITSSFFDPLIKERKEAKRGKTKITVRSVVTSKLVNVEDKTGKGMIRRMRKDMVGCVQAVVWKKMFRNIFKYGQLKETSTGSLTLISAEEEVEKGERKVFMISHKKAKVNC